MLLTLSLVKASLKNLTVHKLRSFLTVLSMVFGTGAVIATLNSNEGAQIFISKQLQSLGTNIIRVEGKGIELKRENQKTLENYADLLETSMLEVTIPNQSIRGGDKTVNAPVLGVTRNYFTEMNLTLKTGRVPDNYDQDHFLPVAVLGAKAKQDLFGKGSAIGRYVSIFQDGTYSMLRVIGVLQEKGAQAGTLDSSIFLTSPLARKYAGKNLQMSLIAVMKDGVESIDAKQQVLALLQPRVKGKVTISDARETIEKTKSIWEKQNLLGICLASVSLLTGGVGIMNIMLLSINQRRREIGLRKAIGARPLDISLQFLVEAATVCFIGGLIGVGFGSFFGSQVASMLGQWEAVTSLKTIGLALVVSTLTGIIFGLLPAIRASKLDPYEALRG